MGHQRGVRDDAPPPRSPSLALANTHPPGSGSPPDEWVALPSALVEGEGSHCRQSDDKEDGRHPVAATPRQLQRTCNGVAVSGQCGQRLCLAWLPQAGRLGRPTLPVHGREDGWSLEMLVLLGSGSKVVSPSSLPWAGIVLICNAVLSVLF